MLKDEWLGLASDPESDPVCRNFHCLCCSFPTCMILIKIVLFSFTLLLLKMCRGFTLKANKFNITNVIIIRWIMNVLTWLCSWIQLYFLVSSIVYLLEYISSMNCIRLHLSMLFLLLLSHISDEFLKIS